MDFSTSNVEESSDDEKKLRRQSSRERRPKRRSVSNMPVEVGTRMLSRNRLRRNSSRRMSQNSMDWEFELNYQLSYAKTKKKERAKEEKELDDMRRAETEQCANCLDKFWGIDAMCNAIANSARAAKHAAADAVNVGEHVMATIHTMLAWVKRGREIGKQKGWEMKKQREETRRKYMREFWSATVISNSKKGGRPEKRRSMNMSQLQRELRCLESDASFPRCVISSMRTGYISRGVGKAS